MDWNHDLDAAPCDEILMIWVKDKGEGYPAIVTKTKIRNGSSWAIHDSFGFNEDGEVPSVDIEAWSFSPKGPLKE